MKHRMLIDQIRHAARQSGLSQNALARATGLNKAAVSKFINSKRGLSMASLNALGQVLKLRIVKDERKAGQRPLKPSDQTKRAKRHQERETVNE